jgi:hypothetical protein
VAALVILLVPLSGSGQEIPRDEYLSQLPLNLPRLGPQSDASVQLALFGDPDQPSFRDADANGIDDTRQTVLQALALRFAPFLIQNSEDIPTDFRAYAENRDVFSLTVDTWNLSGHEAERLGAVELNLSALDGSACPGSERGALQANPEPTRQAALEDCKLLELLDRFAPGTSRTAPVDEGRVRTDPHLLDVLFLDFPGEGPGNWSEGYEAEYRRTSEARQAGFPHSFVHPFIHEVESEGPAGYELILQYWLFYPSNDSGMNHEGDWEHINVVVSPRSRVEAPLDGGTIRRILEGDLAATDDAADPLVIRRVDYYFHDLVMPLDFSQPNVYLPRDQWEARKRSTPQTRFREGEIWDHLRYMAYRDDAETRINTHPFGHIGSDNKGLNQALEMPGGSNRNSHGTFPLAGRYNDVGPGGTTDRIAVDLDHRRFLRDLEAGRVNDGPIFRRGSVVGLARPERITLLPDWERVLDLVLTDASARARWAWMLLPMHWGYPATESPFSNIVENYNTGNVAPVGPTYSTGWNETGPTSSFRLYEPHTIASVFPTEVQDNFRNDLGFLNLTVPVLLNLPPLDFISRIVAYPFRLALSRRDPVYYPREGLPYRFVGLSSGISIQTFDEDFNTLSLNAEHRQEFTSRILIHYLVNEADSATTLVGGGDYMDSATGSFVQLPFYIGERFTSENTIRNTRTSFGVDAEFSDIPSYRYSADINYWEYSGSLRYSLTRSALHPFVKAGYGWSWYRVENARANGVPFEPADSEWFGPDSVWPNVWHYGLGAEFVPFRRVGTDSGGIEVAVRLEYVRYTQILGLDLSEVALDELSVLFNTLADVPNAERVHRNDLTVGLVITF